MRNSILGTVAGLIIGTAGALAYSHYLGDGGRLADLQAQLDAANAKLQKSEADKKLLAQQNNDESDQVNQLVASNEALKKQVANPGDAPTASAAPAPTPSLFDPNLMNGIMAAMRGGRGGFRSPEQRMLLLQKRLNLTSDQQAKIKAAMDADQQARRDLFRQARQNGTPPDPQALAAANTLDKTLTSVLSQYQQSQYQQLQSDEKAARAESSATSQVDDIMPLLQLTDDQKEKALNALYQQQLSAPDPMTLMGNPNAVATLAAQGQSMQAALKQVLNPDQYALYQQSQQVTAQAWANGPGGGRRGNNNGGNGNGGATNAAPGAQTTSTVAAATPTPAPATAAATTTDTTSATNAASATTNAPSTNAPASAPAN